MSSSHHSFLISSRFFDGFGESSLFIAKHNTMKLKNKQATTHHQMPIFFGTGLA